MSWDIVIFNLKRRVEHVDEIDEDILLDINDFESTLLIRFPQIKCTEDLATVETEEFCIEFFLPEAPFSNTIAHLYGEKSIYELIGLCKENGWQAYDTSLGALLDLEKPCVNGYADLIDFVDRLKRT